MTDSLSCREATEADLPQVLRLYAQSGLDDGQMLELAEAQRRFGRMARYPDYRIYVALAGETIVGTFGLLIMDTLAHRGAPCGVVEDVAVESGCQRQGVGRFMMDYAMACCRRKGCFKLALSSNLKRGKAHAFYESLGFERHGYSFLIDLTSSAPGATAPG